MEKNKRHFVGCGMKKLVSLAVCAAMLATTLVTSGVSVAAETTGTYLAPTCTEPGIKEYFVSDGNYYEDAECTVLIPDLTEWASEGHAGYIAPLGHDWAPEDFNYDTNVHYCDREDCDAEGEHVDENGNFVCDICGGYAYSTLFSSKVAAKELITAETGVPRSATMESILQKWLANVDAATSEAAVDTAKTSAFSEIDSQLATEGFTGEYYLKYNVEKGGFERLPIPTTAKDLTATTPNLSAGTYVVRGTVDFAENRAVLSGNVTIILCNGCSWLCPKGISVADGGSLTICCTSFGANMGKLKIDKVDEDNAAIGAEWNKNCGDITIDGGNVYAYGSAAGIGGAHKSSEDVGGDCGNITVNGGYLDIAGGFFGVSTASNSASIGSGRGSACGDITIRGGVLNSHAWHWEAAGIGSGQDGRCGDITISGGKITATSNQYGVGIGNGDESVCGDITINGGFIEAGGAFTAIAIGGIDFYNGDGEDFVSGDICINGGTVIALSTMVNGAISKSCNLSSCETYGKKKITINGGQVTAISFSSGYGIGCLGTVSVNGGHVTSIGSGSPYGDSGALSDFDGTPFIRDGLSVLAGECEATAADTEYTGQRYVEISGPDYIPGVEPTCAEPGVKEYFSADGKKYEDVGCTVEIADFDVWKSEGHAGYIAPLGHLWTYENDDEHSCVREGCGAIDEHVDQNGNSFCDVCFAYMFDPVFLAKANAKELITAETGVPRSATMESILQKWLANVDVATTKAAVSAAKTSAFSEIDAQLATEGFTGEYYLKYNVEKGGFERLPIPTTAKELTADSPNLSAGTYVVRGTVDFTSLDSRAILDGDVSIILCDDSSWICPKGISVAEDGSFTIYCTSFGDKMGKLKIDKVDDDNAAIGGECGKDCGNITIDGGDIATRGGRCSGGIGGGCRERVGHYAGGDPIYGDGGHCGNITINGGNFELFSGLFGAAIGAAMDAFCGDIEIRGGTFDLNAYMDATCIGAPGGGACGNIHISGGVLYSWPGSFVEVIGSWGGTCDDIVLDGGTVIIRGADSYGIGGIGGYCKNIIINDGLFIVASSYSAIEGQSSYSNGGCEQIIMNGGTALVTCGASGPAVLNKNKKNTYAVVVNGGHLIAGSPYKYLDRTNYYPAIDVSEESGIYIRDGLSVLAGDCEATAADTEYTGQRYVEISGPDYIPNVEPTCTEPGAKEYFRKDGVYYSDFDCTKVIDNPTVWVSIGHAGYLPPLGHNWTCNEDQETGHHCLRDGCTVDGEHVDADENFICDVCAYEYLDDAKSEAKAAFVKAAGTPVSDDMKALLTKWNDEVDNAETVYAIGIAKAQALSEIAALLEQEAAAAALAQAKAEAKQELVTDAGYTHSAAIEAILQDGLSSVDKAQTIEEVTAAKNAALAAMEAQRQKEAAEAAALAAAKIAAKTEITVAGGDEPSDAVAEIIRKAFADIDEATTVAKVNEIKTQALSDIAAQLQREGAEEAALAAAKAAAKSAITVAGGDEPSNAVAEIIRKAFAEIDEATTIEQVNEIKERALSEIAAQQQKEAADAADLAAAKAAAKSEITGAGGDEPSNAVAEIIRKAFAEIDEATTIEQVNEIKERALSEIAAQQQKEAEEQKADALAKAKEAAKQALIDAAGEPRSSEMEELLQKWLKAIDDAETIDEVAAVLEQALAEIEAQRQNESKPSDDTPLYGDANGDGSVNMKDVLLMRKFLAGMNVSIDEKAADVDVSGTINMKDVLMMRKFLANVIEKLGA